MNESPRSSPGTLETQLDSLLETFKRGASGAMMSDSPLSSSSSPSQEQASDADIPGRLLRFRLPSARRLPFNLSLKRSRSGVSALSCEQESPPSDGAVSTSACSTSPASHRRSLPGLLEASVDAARNEFHPEKCSSSTDDLSTADPAAKDEDEDVDVMETDDEDSRDASNLRLPASSDCEEEPEQRKKLRKKRTIADYAVHGIDPSKLEESVDEVSNRFKLGCECVDSNCFDGLNAELVYRHRLNIAELTKAEQDMYLMGVTMASITNPETTVKQKERQRLRAQYVYHGKKVCLDAFLYLENCTHYQLKRIRKHVMTHGVVPRIHGNQGKKPHNTFSLDIYRHANSFIESFIETYAAQSTSQSKCKGSKKTTVTLPQKVSRKTLHNEYKEYCAKIDSGIKVMGYSSFRHFITEQFPNIRFTKSEVGIPKSTNVEIFTSKVGAEAKDQPQVVPAATVAQVVTAAPAVVNVGAATVQLQQAQTAMVQPTTLFVDSTGGNTTFTTPAGNTYVITQVLPAGFCQMQSANFQTVSIETIEQQPTTFTLN